MFKSIKIPKLSVTQAAVLSFVTAAITQVVAVVPAWAPYKADAISTAGIVIPAVFLAVHAVHALVDLVRELLASKVTPEELKTDVLNFARTEAQNAVHSSIIRADFDSLAQAAVSGKAGDLQQTAEQLVQQAVDKIFAPFRQQAPASDVQSAQGSTPEPARIVSLVPPLPEQTPPPAAPAPSTPNA